MKEKIDNSQEKILNLSNNKTQFTYTLKNKDIILLIMDFLKNEGYDRTYVSLEEESGINLYNYDENLGILRNFILDGEWEEAEKSLEIFKNKKNFPYKNLIFEIRKEKLIEEVEAQQKDGTFDGLAKELKDLQDLGCNKEFNNLMDYLKETEHDVLNETISRRLEIFNKIRKQITFQYPITKNEINIKPNKLKEIFSKIIEIFINISKNVKNNNNTYNIEDIDNFLKIKIEQDTGINRVDSDTNKNTIIHNSIYNYKDSFRFTDNESNISDKNKNKNSSKKKHKSSLERLAETYDDLDLHLQYEDIEIIKNNKKETKSKNKYSSDKKDNKSVKSNKSNNSINKSNKGDKNNKSNSKKKYQINFGDGGLKQNNNYITKYINNKNQKSKSKESKKENNKKNKRKEKKEMIEEMNKNINNVNIIDNYSNRNNNISIDNDLSDLDQDEYFLKNCYDYYDYDITSLSLKKVIEDTLPIRCCCFSPKGEFFAIGTNSKCLKIYDLSHILDNFTKRNNIYSQLNKNNITASLLSNSKLNKETIGMIFEQKEHHHGSIFCIDWSSSGKLLATGSNDKTIKLMNIPQLIEENNKKIIPDNETFELRITGNQGTVRSLCFEPTNDLVLLSANTGENTIKIWDTIKGMNIACLEGHNSDVNAVKWSNDSQLFASCSVDKTIRFWDIRDCKSINILSGIQYSTINDISVFSKGNNTIVAVGHHDGLVTIWDYSKQCVIKEICEHRKEVRSVAFSPDGKYLLSGSFDSTIKIYDIDNDFCNIGKLEHGDKVVSCKWHPEIPLIVSTSADKTARVWVPSKY